MLITFIGPHAAFAQQNDAQNLDALQAQIAVEKATLRHEELELEQQSLKLDQTEELVDQELQHQRGRGAPVTAQSTPIGTDSDAPQAPINSQPAPQTQTASEESTPAGSGAAAAASQTTSIQGPSPSQKLTKAVLQTDTTLSNAGGVLTPKGHLVVDPSLEYDYYSQNQLDVNGFTIIPGITFGNIYIARIQQNVATLALTTRYGITNRLEVNVKVPLVAEYGVWTTQAVGPDAASLTPSANNVNIGDVQFGASYQFNRDDSGWPVFIGNILYKTATGVSPYNVPIFTVNDPNGGYLQGIYRRLPTGTGFSALEPSVTVLYPTDPGVLFGNLQYIHNFAANVSLQNPGGGPSTNVNLKAGDAVAGTFGFGFALNEKTSMTLSYQQEHVFGASEEGIPIKGSAYDFGTFNFGVGYQISRAVSFNLGVGIGEGPNAPVAKILFEVPVNFNLF